MMEPKVLQIVGDLNTLIELLATKQDLSEEEAEIRKRREWMKTRSTHVQEFSEGYEKLINIHQNSILLFLPQQQYFR